MEFYVPLSIGLLVLVVIAEVIWTSLRKVEHYDLKDLWVTVLLGACGLVANLAMKVWIFAVFSFASTFALLDFEMTGWAWVALFFGNEFTFYWFHRWGHTLRFIWAGHNLHHSSRQFNFSLGIRLPIPLAFYRYLFWIPLCLVGFDPLAVIVMDSINAIYQFFMHAKDVGSLGPLGWVLNTPSHHRVHHGTEAKYVNKNFGGILIIYDRVFGTFQREEETPVYGINKAVQRYNPVSVIFHEWVDMWRDLTKAGSVWEGLRKLWKG